MNRSGVVTTVMITALGTLVLAACVQLGATENDLRAGKPDTGAMVNGSTEFVQCNTPRPEICYEIYQPVCATKDTGLRCVTTPCPATAMEVYSNDCQACADPDVKGFFRKEACDGVDELSDV